MINLGGATPFSPGYGVLDNARVFGIDNGNGGGGSWAPTAISPRPEPTWLVVSLDFATGQECLYLDPPRAVPPGANVVPSATLQMTPEFQANGFDHLCLHVGANNGLWHFDEVRIGTSFGDVREGD